MMSSQAMTPLKDKAYELIKQLILNGELQPGAMLTERILVELLGMSRTPIRAAMERLQAEDLLLYTPDKGMTVADLSMERSVEIYDLRLAVETYVIQKLSCRTWTAEMQEVFRHNLNQQQEAVLASDFAVFTQLDLAFHLKLTEVYGNREITQIMMKINDSMYRIALSVLRKSLNRIRVSYADHLAIFEGIVSGDEAAAIKATQTHLDIGRHILIG
ncbi:MAG: GntR family transcriptional regulator [Gammaproteobacteria bacterium]|nr:GntR family transcriptional regulator [Gammaproteobacteria bacterium]